MRLDGHEQGVVLDPEGVLPDEGRDLLPVAPPATSERPAQEVEAAPIDERVVDGRWVLAPVGGANLVLQEQPVLDQEVEVHEVGVARKGRGALVGRVAQTRGADRQHLPPGLARSGEEVDELPRRLAKASDPIGRRKR